MLIKKPFKKGMGPSIAPYYKAAAAPTFQGPGDIVSGAVTWVSPARAYSAAFAALAGPIMDLVDQAGANPITINILTTGFVDLTAISNWVTAHTVTTIKVTKLYDQSGSGNHFTQATLASMPPLTLSALNGLPGITGSGASFTILTGNITQTAPLTFSFVSERTGNFTTAQNVFSTGGGVVIAGYQNSTNTALLTSGGNATATASDSAFHAIQMVAASAATTIVVDGVSTPTVVGGSVGISGIPLRLVTSNGSGAGLTGLVMEGGLWPGAFNATQYGNMNTNQHSASVGYNF